ncbi:MAG: CDP-glycerol glycerophosphotransferase family protein [Muribaculum sp.]|nr:CDP-glycerol glycerophosphotransferase family protein [Muribaculum sp.]
MKNPKEIIKDIAQSVLSIRSSLVAHDRLMFIPHHGMAANDRYSLINWRSDNALTLANYILENGKCKDKTVTIAITSEDDIASLEQYARRKFPDRKVDFVRYLGDITKKERWTFYSILTECSHVFSSITYRLRPFSKSKATTYVDLGYFPMPFKNDIFSRSDKLYMGLDLFDERDMDYYICNSELAIRLIMPSMSLDYGRYLNLGNCRNDYLISEEYPSDLRSEIEAKVDYPVKKIVLYTPTHRDYEQSLSQEASRQLLGYDMDLVALGRRLKDNGILILCKLHPKQNRAVIKKVLPESIMIHEANDRYGLSELMKVSDALLTDYTSGYYDYLLLDKPVIFNFYDVDRYKDSRGFTFTPIESVCAGDIVKDSAGLEEALMSLDENYSKHKEMRQFVRNLVFSYNDTKSTQRIFNRFLSTIS